jgi:high affinity sulfate transporter 1
MSDQRPTSPHEKRPLLTASNNTNYQSDSPPSPSPSPSQHYIPIEEEDEPMRRMNNNDNYSFRADEEIVINEDRIGSVRKGLSFAKLAKSIPDGEDSFPKSKHEDQTFWAKVKIRFPYYVPVAGWLPNYSVKKSLFKDVVAGLAVSSLLIPQVLAYAILANLPPAMGLYSAFMPVLVYGLMGTSRQLAMGPDAVGSLMVALIVAQNVDPDDPNSLNAVDLARVLSFVGGIFLFVLGMVRVGFLDNVISRPLLSGFVNAVAVTIIIEQWDTLFGLPANSEHSWHKLVYVIEHFYQAQWLTFMIGVISIFLLVLFRVSKKVFKDNPRLYFLRFLPESLIVVIAGIIISATLRLDNYNVRILGDFNSSFPTPSFPPLEISTLQVAIFPAISVAIVGFVESIIVAKLYALRHNYQVSPNRELVATGLANVLGSFFGSYPAFGSLTRTSLADMMGATSQVYGFVTSIVVLLTILFAGPLFYYLPKVVMAAIIMVAATGLIELEDIVFMTKVRAYRDIFLFFLTFLLTIFLGIDQGIFISIGISVFLVIKHTTVPHVTVLGRVGETSKYKDVSTHPDAHLTPGVLIVRIEEALYFANVTQVKELFARIERLGSRTVHPAEKRDVPKLRAIIIHAGYIASMDASALQVLHEMMDNYRQRNVFVCFVKLKGSLKVNFVRSGIIEPTGGDTVYDSIDAAANYVAERLAKEDMGYNSNRGSSTVSRRKIVESQ